MSLVDHFFSDSYLTTLFWEQIARRSSTGRDGVSVSDFWHRIDEEVMLIRRKVIDGTYRFTAYREILRVKRAGVPPRMLSVPTVRDQLVLVALKNLLHEMFPDRVNRQLPNAMVRAIKGVVSQPTLGDLSVFQTDVIGFYDHINHERLLDNVRSRVQEPEIVRLIKAAIRTPTVSRGVGRATARQQRNALGVPQGLAISNILADVYLTEFDAALASQSIYYSRYVDDILTIIPSVELSVIGSRIDELLTAIDLKRNPDKTDSGPVSAGFEYLGYSFQSNLLTVRPASVQRFIDSIAAQIISFGRGLPAHLGRRPWLVKQVAVDAFIEDLNERITGAIAGDRRYGWLFYFSEMDDVALLHKLDAIVDQLILRVPEFQKFPPKGVKRLTRAYRLMRHQPRSSYFQDYNRFLTPSTKARYLSRRGYLVPGQQYSDDVLDALFFRVKKRHLDSLEEDVGVIS